MSSGGDSEFLHMCDECVRPHDALSCACPYCGAEYVPAERSWGDLDKARDDAYSSGYREFFLAGYQTGTEWAGAYVPRGPHVHNAESQRANDAWRAGFEWALKKRGVSL